MNAAVEWDAYAVAARERIRRIRRLRANPKLLTPLRAFYRTNIAQMIEDWGVTIDPRNVSRGPVIMPFLLDQRQREWLEFTIEGWQKQLYGLTVKSRDVGVSWLIVGFSVSVCELFDNVTIGWGSYKQEKVDRTGDLGSLFEKGRQYIDFQPRELRAGHDSQSHAFERRLLFPETGSSILGEIGDQIGRGGRTTLYFVDETAYLEHGDVVDAALSKNTNCRQDASSVHGMKNSFATRAHQKGVRRFDFHWRQNPRFTDKDYEAFLELWGPVITAQELDMNFQASVEGIVIPAVWANACVDAHIKLRSHPTQPFPERVTGEWLAALDVADQGRDKNAAGVRHGVLLEHAETFSGKDSDLFATTERSFLVCDSHGPCRRLRYDADGLGAGIRGDARKVNEKRNPAKLIEVEPFRGSAAVFEPLREMVEGRKNEDFFLNRKAQGWWWLRMLAQHTYRAVQGEPYDPELILAISSAIPELPKLLIELSQPTYSQNQVGKLVIDKQPEGTPSPNLGDLVMMLYARGRRGLKIADSVIGDEPVEE